MENILTFSGLAKYFINRYNIRSTETQLHLDVSHLSVEISHLAQPSPIDTSAPELSPCCMSARTFKAYFLPDLASWLEAEKDAGHITYLADAVRSDLDCDGSYLLRGHDLEALLSGCIDRYQIRSCNTSKLVDADDTSNLYHWLNDFLNTTCLSDGTTLWDKFCVPSRVRGYHMADAIFGAYCLPAMSSYLYDEKKAHKIIFDDSMLTSDIYAICDPDEKHVEDKTVAPISTDPDLEALMDSISDLYGSLYQLSDDIDAETSPQAALQEVHVELALRRVMPSLGVWAILYHETGIGKPVISAYATKEEAEASITAAASDAAQSLISQGATQIDVHYHMDDHSAFVHSGEKEMNWTRLYE